MQNGQEWACCTAGKTWRKGPFMTFPAWRVKWSHVQSCDARHRRCAGNYRRDHRACRERLIGWIS